jgi:hypothetical protein
MKYILLYIVLCMVLSPLNAQPGYPPSYWIKHEITASPPTPGDFFGYDVDISADGSTAIVNQPGTSNPATYLYIRQMHDWVQQQILQQSGVVALNADGSTALVGTSVFVRAGTQWSLQQTLPVSGDAAGVDLTADGQLAFIGVPEVNQHRGAVYIFARSGNTWSLAQTLYAQDGQPDNAFGEALVVSLDGSTLLIGAPGTFNAGQIGRAYLFVRSGALWVQQRKLEALDGVASDFFGASVALNRDGTVAVIGAEGKGQMLGRAYLFLGTQGVWTQKQRLMPDEAEAGDRYGRAVAVDGSGTIAMVSRVGGFYDEANQIPAWGRVLIFLQTGNTRVLHQTIAGTGTMGGAFGNSIALTADGQAVLIGEPSTLTDEEGSGKADFYTSEYSGEILVNSNFEDDGNGDRVPDGWTRRYGSEDRRVCNQPGKGVAFSGECVFEFKGSENENSRLVQIIDLQPYHYGVDGLLLFEGYINAKGSVNLRMIVSVQYANASKPEDKLIIDFKKPTKGYEVFAWGRALSVTDRPVRVRVMIQNYSKDGRVRIDALRLLITGDAIPLQTLPLPSAP